MCIIVAKKKEVDLPSIDTLKTCFDHNSDGAGLMYVDNGKVVIDKGYMTFDEFKKHYEKLCRKYDNFKNKSLVLHFRIGTSGTNTKENTHPYCISENYKDLHNIKVVTNLGMVHNGIITEYTPKDNVNNTNDTQEFIMKYIAPLYKNYKDFYKNEYIMKGLEDITNSKLTFLDSNDDLYFVGDFIEDNGIMYSNSTYKRYYYTELYKNYNRVWDTETGTYLPNYGYDYIKDDKDYEDEVNVSRLEKLDSTYYISNTLYGWEQVGDRDLYIDIYNFDLYEKSDNNTLFLRGHDTFVYDQDYNEVY